MARLTNRREQYGHSTRPKGARLRYTLGWPSGEAAPPGPPAQAATIALVSTVSNGVIHNPETERIPRQSWIAPLLSRRSRRRESTDPRRTHLPLTLAGRRAEKCQCSWQVNRLPIDRLARRMIRVAAGQSMIRFAPVFGRVGAVRCGRGGGASVF